jgi:hypothetical protein
MVRNATAFALLLSCLTTVSLAAVGSRISPHQDPGFSRPDTSAPDAWGYTWVRSNEPGGPTFNWVDITTRGTLVTGLGDDNYVGPFPIQFNFPYYWYSVNRFYVGSNGFICFSSPANFASPFAALPSTGSTVPKDLLAICVGDLDFTVAASNPRCYYWTNGSDSLVVSFIDVTEWQQVANPNLKHTFQVVINKADSSITYQYGVQQGRYASTNNTTLCIGWQNQTGQIGLSYTYSTAPPHALLPDSGIAIKIKRTINTGLSVIDAGIVGGFDALNQAKVLRTGIADSMKAFVKNFGTTNISNAQVRYAITRTGQPSAFDTVIVPSLLAGEETIVTFPRLFTPAIDGSYSALFNVTVAGDVGPGNNSRTAEIYAATFGIGQRTNVRFENGTVSGSTSWLGGGGFGVAIDLPQAVYPVRVESVYVRTGTVTTQPMTVEILDGSTGIPGAVLATRTVTATASALNAIDFRSDSVRLPSGRRFFVGARGDMQFSYETTAPIAFRTWEYTNGWAPYRSQDAQDIIIRATVVQENPPPPVDTLLVIYPDSTTGTATNQGYKRADRDTTNRYLAQYYSGPVRRVYIDTTGATLPDLSNYKTILYVESSFDAAISRYMGNTPRTALKNWLNAGTPSDKRKLVMMGGDLGFNYSRSQTGGAFDTVFAHQMLRYVYRLDNGNVTGQNSITGEAVNNGQVFGLNTAAGGFWPDGCQPRTGTGVSVLYRYTGRSANDTVASVGYAASGYTSVSVFQDPRYFTGVFGPVLQSALQFAGIITDMRSPSAEIPGEFSLSQNYPNPFNPTTTIRFSLTTAADVTLKIYNVLGQEVVTLAQGPHTMGAFQTEWDGRNSAGSPVGTGVYFYSITVKPANGGNTFVSTKKMLLLK